MTEAQTRPRLAFFRVIALVAPLATVALAAPDAGAQAARQSEPAPEAKVPDGAPATDSSAKAKGTDATWDPYDVEEAPDKTYLFVGARYRGNVIPQFMLNAFVDEGATVYSNTVGIELERRKDGFSLIPSLSLTEYGTGDILFKEKDSKDIAGNYSLVNSSMKALYATVDILWSKRLSKNIDFEYGLGFGLGIVFGDLMTNWVKAADPSRPVSSGNYQPCAVVEGPGTGCNAADHQNSDVNKVGGYQEPSWFNGGSKPVLFPWISPQLGIRWKPMKQLAARFGLGFGLTGLWFGISGAYGLEQKPAP